MVSIMSRIPRVLVFLPSAVKTYREIMTGILNYSNTFGPWNIRVIQNRPDELGDLETDTAAGMIGWIPQKILVHVPKSCAVIPLDDGDSPKEILTAARRRHPSIFCENGRIGSEAAKYLMEKNFTRFAFLGYGEAVWSEERRIAFVHTIKSAGLSCQTLPSRLTTASLRHLPKPIAVFAANDIRGRQLCDLCLREGIEIPRQVAVLACDNDELLCETCQPPLSSIQMDTIDAGFAAAQALDRMMRGESGGGDIVYGFARIVARASSDTDNIDDLLANKVRNLIVLNWQKKITTDAIARQLHASRRMLERHFRAATGRTIRDEIICTRLEHAKQMLHNPALSIDEIALTCGFSSASHFGEAFRKRFRTTPTDSRTAERPRR